MDEVAFQDEVVAVLKKSLEGADVSIYLRLLACTPLRMLQLVHKKYCQVIVMGVEECL